MSLLDHLSLVEDPRSSINLQHDLVDVMFLVIASVASGMEGWAEIEEFGNDHLDWFRQYRDFKSGIPTRHSIARIFKLVNAEQLTLAMFSWVNAQRKQAGQTVLALDGKTLRGAVNRNDKHEKLHMVTAFDTTDGVVLYQQPTPVKGGEVAAVRDVISMLNIKDTVLTMDALHCQVETLAQIQAKKGDYIVQVKKNQPSVHTAISEAFAPHWANDGQGLAQHEQSDKGHDRIERRTVFQLPANLSKELQKRWPSAKSFIAVERERKAKGRTSQDTSFYISSLEVNPEKAFNCVRKHWHTENRQHWVLDVTFKEDASLIGDREAAERFALFRRIALNLVAQNPLKLSKRIKIKKASWNDEFRSELFFGKQI